MDEVYSGINECGKIGVLSEDLINYLIKTDYCKDEYINKEEALNEIREKCICGHLPFRSNTPEGIMILQAIRVIDSMPAADVRPVVRGEWVEYTKTAYGPVGKDGNLIEREVKTYCCKKCGRETVIKENFCPDCGADMRGE